MMNKKILLIPTLTLSAAILLSGCTGGNMGDNPNASNPNSTSSSSPSGTDSEIPNEEVMPIAIGDATPPEEMESKYKSFYFAPTTIDTKKDGAWSYYEGIGSKSYLEDSAARTISTDEYNSLKEDEGSFQKYDKVYGEISSDVEQTAMKVSKLVEDNPKTTLEEINSTKNLIINRYENIGSVTIEKDENTGFYFTLFTHKEGHTIYGILVPQDGVTPDFSNGFTE